MQFDKIHNKGQARLFKSHYLEYLTKTHPLVIWGMYIPIMFFMLYYTRTRLQQEPLRIFLIFLGGAFTWTFFEYILHRFIFHFIPHTDKARRISYIMHGNHHHYPRDRQRLFMPPVPSLILASFFFSIMYLVLHQTAFMFFPGFLLGYLMYGTMHYAIHAWNPPFKWMKPLWRNHHLHHYKNDHQGFGVSTTLWDRIFGTMFDLKKEKEDKEKVRELMFEKRG
jgi:sterol desaturase/sphingolipid hydroxylase (fatty acid hydroxylase superfamily)